MKISPITNYSNYKAQNTKQQNFGSLKVSPEMLNSKALKKPLESFTTLNEIIEATEETLFRDKNHLKKLQDMINKKIIILNNEEKQRVFFGLANISNDENFEAFSKLIKGAKEDLSTEQILKGLRERAKCEKMSEDIYDEFGL